MAGLRMQVVSFEWDEDNERECRNHGLTDRVVTEVNDRQPLYFNNKVGRRATVMMVGPDARGRFWAVAILPTRIKGCWRPIRVIRPKNRK
jgi:uncharacterized DUF497 family protein